ncbi:terminase small subunit [Mesorhizobium onobrychidis]|uniref:Terminase small subunit n=1 Tax=Mesorhizobium onobrychidis TaxID=2775404 RepID=A0ABY5QUX6_9HYPH|nr:terminase small subunit [Mesorhizobium onobrychidis]UVC14719.1 terminase small subunit [Mesorhizobium onobrychidis]
MSDLTPKQVRFVEEYLIDLNATQAAIRAGYSAKTAKSQGQRLLTNVDVGAALAEAQQKRSLVTGITAERVLTELAKIGFSDIRNVVRWRSNVSAMVEDEETGEQRLAITNEVALINSDDLTDEAASCISEISQTEKGGLKIKLHDKRAALVDMGKHLGLFDGDGKVPPAVNVTINNIDVQITQVRTDLTEIFGDALPRASSDDTPRVN